MKGVCDQLLREAKTSMSKLSDFRKPSNAKRYKVEEAGMGALSVFMMQDASFLSHQERLAKTGGKHNFEGLFGCKNIPTPNQTRNILDPIAPEEFWSLYHNGLNMLVRHNGSEQFQVLGGYLIALDGTQNYCSGALKCESCTVKMHKDVPTYSHSVLCASIVSPDIKEAIPLIPEFIIPQDGHEKQDCENAACKRWLSTHGKTYKHLNPTILGDDLFSRQPVCEAILQEGYNFILTCKPSSHKTLYGYLSRADLSKINITLKKRYKTYVYQYKFINQVPIRDGADALLVNWVEMTQIEKKTGKKVYSNAFVTSHNIDFDNVHTIAAAGRARWSLENENNNTLKTKGYNFEHNYGHGKINLCSILCSLTIIAFLYHTVMSIVDILYIRARQANGSRINFFNILKVVTSMILFSSWDALMLFVFDPPDIGARLGKF